MSIRGTVARLERTIAAVRAAQAPWFQILEQHEGEPDDLWRARYEDVQRRVEAARAAGRRAYVIIVDREEGQ